MQKSILSFFSKSSEKQKEKNELKRESSGTCSASFIKEQTPKRPVIVILRTLLLLSYMTSFFFCYISITLFKLLG